AGVLDPFAGGARRPSSLPPLRLAYNLLGRLDSLNTVRTRRSFYRWASRRLCCSGQREKATVSKLSNLPSLRKLRRSSGTLSKRRPLSTAICDSVHRRPLDRIAL